MTLPDRVRAFSNSPVRFSADSQQGLNFRQVRLNFKGRSQMRLSLGIVPLKEEQNSQVCLSIQVSRLQGNQRLKLRNSEVGPVLVQVLLGQPGVGCNLVLIATRRLGEEGDGGEE